MLVGYMHISKTDGSQTLTLQRDALTEAGVEPSRIYEDAASGRQDDRPGLRACLKALQPGNTLVVWKLDRLGRDLKHLVGLVDDLNQRQVGLKVLAGTGAQIDTTTANGRLVFGIFAALAEFEAELIRERTKAGLTAARARGRVGGRPRKVTLATLKMAMAALADPQSNANDVARRLGITRTTLYTYVNGDGSVKEAGQRLLEMEQTSATQKTRKTAELVDTVQST
jgi:DNA invertase Pin-like site-specific DNA recombinase